MTPTPPYPRAASRPDGAQARAKLLHHALQLFAERGLNGTSTRDIAQAAGTNVSAISYYFGDKAGLYRAVFFEPLGDLCRRGSSFEIAGSTLAERLRRYFTEFLAPLQLGDELRLVMRLHFREMIDPTGLWAEVVENEFKPQHAALVSMLQAELGLPEPDADLHRLVFSLVGMPVHFFVGLDVIDQIAPEVIDGAAVDLLAERLTGYATAMVEAERARRATAGGHA